MARADVRKKAASSSAAAGPAGAAAPAPDPTLDGASPPVAGEPPLAFEAALSKLEEVVDRLEGGELDLEVALANFEEGVRLTRQCAEQLDTAERRIEILMKEGDGFMVRPFDDDPEDDPDTDPDAEPSDDEASWED